jgi:hypothetical protein
MAEFRAAVGPRAPGERHGTKGRRAPAGRHEPAEELVVERAPQERDPQEAQRATVSAVGAAAAAPRVLGVRVPAAQQAALAAPAAQQAPTEMVAVAVAASLGAASRRHFRIVAHGEAPRVVATARVVRLAGDGAATRQVALTPVGALDRVAATRGQVTVAAGPGRMPVVAPRATSVRHRETARRRVTAVPRPPAPPAPPAAVALAAAICAAATRAVAGTRRLDVRKVAVPASAPPVSPRDHGDRRHLEGRAHPE